MNWSSHDQADDKEATMSSWMKPLVAIRAVQLLLRPLHLTAPRPACWSIKTNLWDQESILPWKSGQSQESVGNLVERNFIQAESWYQISCSMDRNTQIYRFWLSWMWDLFHLMGFSLICFSSPPHTFRSSVGHWIWLVVSGLPIRNRMWESGRW